MKSSKSQTPGCRETRNPKLQKRGKYDSELKFGASLELGVWDLKFRYRAQMRFDLTRPVVNRL